MIIKINLKILLFKLIKFFPTFLLPPTESMIKVKAYFGHHGMQEYWKTNPNNKKKKNKVIIYGLRTYATHHQAVFEKVCSDLFRFNGANVKNLICDNILPSYDGGPGLSSWFTCYLCRKERKYHFENFPNDFISFGQFISKEEIEQIRHDVENLSDDELEHHEYMGVRAGLHAFDSVEFFFQYLFDRKNKDHLRKLRDGVYRGMITIKVAQNLFEAEKPTHLLTLHGAYASWGPFSEYMSKKGVKVFIYEISLTPGMGYFNFYKLFFNEDDGRKDMRKDIPAEDAWKNKEYEALSENEREQIHNFLLKRKEGKSFDYLMFYEQKKGNDNECLKMLNSTNKRFVLYMHSLWDRGIDDVESDCFKDHTEWLKKTIEYFIKNPDTYLFIKPHPAEFSVWDYQKHGGNDVILNFFNKLPPNIFLIKKDMPITSYELMDKGCIGITYFGTVGLESSFFKKPVLVGANTHYTKAGVVYKIKSQKEYFKLIDDPQPLYKFSHEKYYVIEKYAYHYFFRQSLRIPFYREDKWLGHCIDWDVLSNYKDFIENDKTMNHIALSILNNKNVVRID